MTRTRLLARLSAMVAALSLSAAACAATECSIAGRDQASVAKAGTPVKLPALLEDCEGITVTKGEIIACVQDPRGRLRCRTFSATTTLTASGLGPSGTDRGLLDVLMEMLRGEGASVGAVNRSTVESVLPTGVVAFAGGPVDLNFADPRWSDVQRIEFTDVGSGTSVLTLRGPGKASLDPALFSAGRSYAWTLRSISPMRDERTGRFSIARAAEQREAQQEAARISSDASDPSSQAATIAVWLHSRGLHYDAGRALRRAGLMPP